MYDVVIFAPTARPHEVYNFEKYENLAMGGADYMLFKLCEILKLKGLDVLAFLPIERCYVNDNLKCYPYMDIFNFEEISCNYYIQYRKMNAIPRCINSQFNIFYSQDLATTSCFEGISSSESFDVYDKIIALSNFHKQHLMNNFKIDESKICVIGNAVEKPKAKMLTELRLENINFMYASAPFKGLKNLIPIWEKLSKKYKYAKLNIFSSMRLYNDKLSDLMFSNIYEKLKSMKNVNLYGVVNKSALYKAMQRNTLLLYPNDYEETFCNVLLECRYNYLPFITSDLGALKETGGKSGIYISGNVATEKYQNEFIDAIDYVLSNKKLYKKMQFECKNARTLKDYVNDLRTKLRLF